MTNSAPVTPNELANRIRLRWEKGLGCYDAAFEILHAAWCNGEIRPGPGPIAIGSETPIGPHTFAYRVSLLVGEGTASYEATKQVIDDAIGAGEIHIGKPAPHTPAPQAGRLRLLPATLFTIGIITGLPMLLWLIGYGLLPVYAWGLSWAR